MPNTREGKHQVKTRMSLASLTLGDRKKFPPEVKIVNMIHATHTFTRRHERTLKDAHDAEPIVPTSDY